MKQSALVIGPCALGVGRVLSSLGYQTMIAMVRPKRRNRLKHLHVIRACPVELPVASRSIDLLVVAGGRLGRLANLAGALTQLARVLRIGGSLVVLSGAVKTFPRRVFSAPTRFWRRHQKQILSPEQLSSAFLFAGFSELQQKQVGTIFPVLITIGYATRASHILQAAYL